MNTLQKAMIGVGASLAVGAGAYAAEQIIDAPLPPEQVHERLIECDTLKDERIRNRCRFEADGRGFDFLDVIQLGSLATLAGSSYFALQSLRREIPGRQA